MSLQGSEELRSILGYCVVPAKRTRSSISFVAASNRLRESHGIGGEPGTFERSEILVVME